MARTSPIYVPIVGEDELSKKLAKVQTRVSKFAAGLSSVGSTLTRYVSLPLAAAGLASLKFARDLNEGMANVGTLIPGNRERLEELKKSVQSLSVETGKSTGDIVEGLYETVSAFGDSADTIKNLEIATKAGVAGRAGTLESIQLLSAVTKAYGDTSAAAMQKVSDLSFLTVKLGQTNFPQLAASIGKVASTANTFKVSQEELFGTFATFTGVTGDAAEVATEISSAFSGVMKPTTDMTRAMKNFGFASAGAAMEQLGLRDMMLAVGVASLDPKTKTQALKDIGFNSVKAAKKAMGAKEAIEAISKAAGARTSPAVSTKLKELGFNSFEAAKKQLGLAKALDLVSGAAGLNKDALGKLYSRKEAQLLVLAALGGQTEAYAEKLGLVTEESKKAGKATRDAYKEQTEGINKSGHDWKKFLARLQVFAQRVGDKLMPVMEKFFNVITPLLEKFEKMDNATLEWGIKLAGLAIAVGPVLKGLGGLTSIFSNSIGLMALNKKGLSSLAFQYDAVTGKLTGVTSAAKTAGSALGRITGTSAAVLGAATVGYGIGETLNTMVIDPQTKRAVKTREDIEGTRYKAERIARTGTKEEKIKAVYELDNAIKKMPDTIATVEDAAGMIASIFTDVESPIERMARQTKGLVDAQKALLASIKQEEIARRNNIPAETKHVTKEVVEVTFPNKPPDVKVRRSIRRTANTGVVLAGAQ